MVSVRLRASGAGMLRAALLLAGSRAAGTLPSKPECLGDVVSPMPYKCPDPHPTQCGASCSWLTCCLLAALGCWAAPSRPVRRLLAGGASRGCWAARAGAAQTAARVGRVGVAGAHLVAEAPQEARQADEVRPVEDGDVEADMDEQRRRDFDFAAQEVEASD